MLIEKISAVLWGIPTVGVLTLSGIVLSWNEGFIALRRFPLMVRTVFGGITRKSDKSDGVSPFEALCTALSGTIGTGNIAGVVIALSFGGAGAVFWMWVSAFIGMGIKYAEILLAVKYREKINGEYVGGPMYTIKNGLGAKYNALAVAFSFFGMCASFGIGNMMQVGSVMTALENAVEVFLPGADTGIVFKALAGTAIAVMCAVSISGGAKGRGRLAAKLIPFMSVIYISGAMAVILRNIKMLPSVFTGILSEAFSVKALSGGAIAWGFRRGLFSNEAGLGSSPIAHASANAKSPARQGLWGIFEVFTDTIVICTLTALLILVSGVPIEYGAVAGAELCAAALGTVFGEPLSAIFMAVSMTLFSFSSIVGWSLYGERCAGYLFDAKGERVYRAVFILAVAVSSVADLNVIIRLSDIMNALMIAPNIISLLMLSHVVRRETQEIL